MGSIVNTLGVIVLAAITIAFGQTWLGFGILAIEAVARSFLMHLWRKHAFEPATPIEGAD